MNQLLLCLLSVVTTLSSPDLRLTIKLQQDEDSKLSWTAAYDGKTMLAPSTLGLVTDQFNYTQLEFTGESSETVHIDYSLDRIKTSHVSHDATRALLHFRTPSGRLLDMEWHISANDIAFRYLLPKDSETGSVRVLREATSFDFPAGTTTFLCPQSDAMIGWKRSKPSYEELYTLDAPMDRKSKSGHGYTFPCLFKVGIDGWVLVSETGVDSRYCASRLGDYEPGTGYSIAFPMAEENNGNGTPEPAFALPGATPWRTLSIGSDLAPIAQTTITFDVVEPRYETTHDYRFGKSTWSWILWQDDSINDHDIRAYVDLAAQMGFPYTLIDAGWDVNIGRPGIEKIVEYARSKSVEVFLWYSSSGWWNDIVQSPTNIMSDHIARKKEMRWLESIGVKGIKVDFFGGDKQETMHLYENILSDADDHGLMVIFHGCTIPRGWERMYPNYVGSEAVLASENMIFAQLHCDIEAQSACLHPFIRNAIGCMEYGGSFLNKRLSRDNAHGSVRRTSDALELALAVIYQNPIQNFAIAPNNLTDAPAEALDFLREVPTTWDETRLLDGIAGNHVVLARRHADTWYIGAINASAQPLTIDPAALATRLVAAGTPLGATAGTSRADSSRASGKTPGMEVSYDVIATTKTGTLTRTHATAKTAAQTASRAASRTISIPQNDGAVITVRINK